MAHPKTSFRRARAISSALFLLSFAIICYRQTYWPEIMLAIGIPLAVRQFLLGRVYDTFMSLFIFIGFYIIAQFDISWDILLPVIFTISGLYILIKEFCDPYPTTESEDEESLSHEIEEDETR